MARRRAVRGPPRDGGIGGVGGRAQERAVGLLRPSRPAGVPAVPPAARDAPAGGAGTAGLLRARPSALRRGAPGQTGRRHAAAHHPDPRLVEAGARRKGRPAVRRSDAGPGSRGRSRGGPRRAPLRRRHRGRVAAVRPRADPGGRPRRLVLCRQAGLAGEPAQRLPAMAGQHERVVAVPLPGRRRCPARRPVALARPVRAGTPGGGAVFRRARVAPRRRLQRGVPPVLVRRGSLPVPRRPRPLRPLRVGCRPSPLVERTRASAAPSTSAPASSSWRSRSSPAGTSRPSATRRPAAWRPSRATPRRGRRCTTWACS